MKSKYIIGADIGGMSVKFGLFDDAGEFLSEWAIPTRVENSGASVLGDIAQSLSEKLSAEAVDRSDVLGMGITVPGPVLGDGTVKYAVNIGWGEFNIERELFGLTGLRIKAGNDANVAALGELWKGGGMGYSDIMMVTLGTGVGGGLIIGGKIRNGVNGAAAEIGHIPFREAEDEPDTCGCGKRGCLEQYTSARGVLRTARRYLDAHPEKPCPLRDMPDFTSKDIFDLVKAGDETACEIAEIIYKYLGMGLATVSAVTDVEAFVVGGGMSKAGQVLIDGIKKYYVQYAFPVTRNAAITLAKLGNRAGIYGAAKLIIDSTAV